MEGKNMVKGHPDPRWKKVTKDGMTPITRTEGRKVSKNLNGNEKEINDQLIEYEWPGE